MLQKTFFILAAMNVLTACGDSDSRSNDDSVEALYTATCESACDNLLSCGDMSEGDVSDCVVDCQTEPWPANYKQCRTNNCAMSDAQCETYGVKTCEEACNNAISCGDAFDTELNACVADCKDEPWPGNYIDCKATLCGTSDRQCEDFTGS